MHLVVMQPDWKLNEKIKIISKVTQNFPNLLMIENNEKQLPLHVSALGDVKGQRLLQHLTKLTIKQSGNSDIFTANIETAILTLEKAIEINKGLSEEYWKNFEDILKSHGPRLLQKCITADKTHKSLKGIFATSVKIDPNTFYDGKNAFLTMLEYDISFAWCSRPGEGVYKRFKLLMEVNIEQRKT